MYLFVSVSFIFFFVFRNFMYSFQCTPSFWLRSCLRTSHLKRNRHIAPAKVVLGSPQNSLKALRAMRPKKYEGPMKCCLPEMLLSNSIGETIAVTFLELVSTKLRPAKVTIK